MADPNEKSAVDEQRKLRLAAELRQSAQEAAALPWYRSRLLAAAQELETSQIRTVSN